MSTDRRVGYFPQPTALQPTTLQPTTLQPVAGQGAASAQDFFGALAQAMRDARPLMPPPSAVPAPPAQPQAQAQPQSEPTPGPDTSDPAYQLLNRGGSLKLQQLADYAKANAAQDPFGLGPLGNQVVGPYGYGLATAPALTVPPGFNGGFEPVNGAGQMTTIPGNGDGANDIYGFFVPVGTVKDGQKVPGFGDGTGYTGFGAPTFGGVPFGYDSANPALLFDPLSGTLLNRVL